MEREYREALTADVQEDKSTHKTYTVYKISTPAGNIYIGYTSQKLKDRLRQHRYKALTGQCIGHPLYDAIRKCNGEGLTIEPICCVNDRNTAMRLEEENIALTSSEQSANLTRGGRYDGTDAAGAFWKKINADAEGKTKYLETLSKRKLDDDWSDYDKLTDAAEQWRKDNPKEAYRISYRAIRIANKKNGYPPPCYVECDNRPLKERLMHKFKLNKVKSDYVTQVWSRRTVEEKKAIGKKIGEAQKRHMNNLTKDEKREATKKARSSIDRTVQGPAASKGLKNWWTELRKDPERYNAYIASRIETQRRNREMKKIQSKQGEDIS